MKFLGTQKEIETQIKRSLRTCPWLDGSTSTSLRNEGRVTQAARTFTYKHLLIDLPHLRNSVLVKPLEQLAIHFFKWIESFLALKCLLQEMVLPFFWQIRAFNELGILACGLIAGQQQRRRDEKILSRLDWTVANPKIPRLRIPSIILRQIWKDRPKQLMTPIQHTGRESFEVTMLEEADRGLSKRGTGPRAAWFDKRRFKVHAIRQI